MHISEGILPGSTLFTGYILTFIGTFIGLRKIKSNNIGKIAVISATFFIASLIQIPIGISNAHLSLNGLMGLILGWAAFPAIIVVLIIQAVMFQYGGITTLGINTIILAVPSICCHYLLKPFILKHSFISSILAFICGSLSVIMSLILLRIVILTSYAEFDQIVNVIILAYIPIIFIEGIITTSCLSFLKKVKPEIFFKH